MAEEEPDINPIESSNEKDKQKVVVNEPQEQETQNEKIETDDNVSAAEKGDEKPEIDPFEIQDQYLEDLADDEEEEEEDEHVITYTEMLDVERILEEPVDLTNEHLKNIANELGLIKLCWPDIASVEFEGRTNFPKSYLSNNSKEKLLLLYAENFRRQFCYKYPYRKPLYLASDNECGMQKMVCTTIHPTTLPYPEIENWETCSKFVANHFKYEPLEVPVLIPNRLYSPHTSFLRQSGHAFELATSLCSLLIGLGYDAFVVSGYAIEDITKRIMIRTECPYPPFKEEEKVVEEEVIDQKYKITNQAEMESKFLKMMAQRKLDQKREEEERIAEIERQRILEEEKRPEDELEGQRIHAWVLLLAGTHDIEESIFIEPSTALSYPVDSDYYTGIESIWNHQNYWVNVQDCSNGLTNIDYDLTNTEKWEHLLIGEPLKWRKEKPKDMGEEDDAALMSMYDEKHLDMPKSWSMRIHIPHDVLKRRFPDGSRTTQFKRTLVEEYANYVLDDGLVTKISRFKDFECTNDLQTVEEEYKNRHDKLIRRMTDMTTNIVTEYFSSGRDDSVIKHTYFRDAADSLLAERTIFFNHRARYDSLSKLEYKNNVLTAHFIDREDRLYYLQVIFDKAGETNSSEIVDKNRRPISKIIQKFSKNESSIATENDIAVREFNIFDREIQLKYHYGKNSVTASTRVFLKPPIAEMGDGMVFRPELTSGYQAKLGSKPPRQLQLYILMEEQLVEEEETIKAVRETEKQISDFLLLRVHEMAFAKMDVSLFNVEQNADYKMGMLEQEELARIHKEREVEKDIDYLAPYLAKQGNPPKLSVSQAVDVRHQCLEEFKELLVNRANDIQFQFERLSELVENRQAWYTMNHEDLTPDEESYYFQEINNMLFRVRTLEIRLKRHKEWSHTRYNNIVQYVDQHPALQILNK